MRSDVRKDRDEITEALRQAVAVSRRVTRRVPDHFNPWHYADERVRECLDELLYELREERQS